MNGSRVIVFLVVALCAVSVFAQDAAGVAVNEVPEWLIEFISFISSVPYLGPATVFVGKWAGFISAIFTMIVIFVTSAFKIPEIALRLGKFTNFADKLSLWHSKIMPYLKYLSMFNVQKKK